MTHDNDKTRGSMGLSDDGLDRVAIMLNTQKAIDIMFNQGADMNDENNNIDSYTPEEWLVDGMTVYALRGGVNAFTANVYPAEWSREKEAIANAKLMAAAPELLDALEEARTHIVELCNCHDHPYPESSFRRYDKTIAKARGQV